MIPIVTPDEMAAIDAAAPEPVELLIDRAGAAVARSARRLLGGTYGRRVVVLAGPGNNGADGRVAAGRLRRAGAVVEVVDPRAGVATLPNADLVIDGAYGTGINRPWEPPATEAPVLAVDIPSGISGLDGRLHGGALVADATVSFAALKPGLLLGAGPAHVGRIDIPDIGLDVSSARAALVTAQDVGSWVPSRVADAHKWRSGVRVIAGSPGMTGAGTLVAAAAMRAGAGIVHATSPGAQGRWPTEVVGRAASADGWATEVLEDHERFAAVVVGPGLGRDPSARAELDRLLAGCRRPVVVDADGLALLDPDTVRARSVPTVLTPHDGEFAALAGEPPEDDRIEAARSLAADLGAVVLLKGPTTVVAEPGGFAQLSDQGDQRLATAGSGDVLSGVIGAYVARGAEPAAAAAAAAFVHGRAALASPEEGTVASDLLDRLGPALGSCR
ncbi:MAG: NAD(P)H-hydrate dehydratase [Actinomycetota bacterium]